MNISGEDNKNGLKTIDEIIQIYQKYKQLNPINCKLVGLMMIGEIDQSERDFSNMIKLRIQLEDLAKLHAKFMFIKRLKMN